MNFDWATSSPQQRVEAMGMSANMVAGETGLGSETSINGSSFQEIGTLITPFENWQLSMQGVGVTILPPQAMAKIQVTHGGLVPEKGVFYSALIQSAETFQASVVGPALNAVVSTRAQFDGRLEVRSILPYPVGTGRAGPNLPMLPTNEVTIILEPFGGGIWTISTAFPGGTGKAAGTEL